ncbi:hypothetical protein CFC21_057812 [Triticum aestivum]|uniref:Uncharacterized protein n=1 Tax=Triticum aestivum TaxID=4565 RepID=A0A9R1GM98_WHEAT|nr:hypothetical protein CFC21_057812 [Triticum aestivum]
MRHPVSRVMVDPSGNGSGSLVLVQFEGLSGQKIIELLNLNGHREEWRIEVVGCQLQILGLRKELKAEVMVASFNFLLSNSSRVLPRSEDEGKKKNLTKEFKKMKQCTGQRQSAIKTICLQVLYYQRRLCQEEG